MKLIIDIDEDVRIAISQMGLLRIPNEMRKKVDKAIQHGIPLEQISDDIKQKIVRHSGLNHSRMERDRNDAFLEALDIIDKYNKE